MQTDALFQRYIEQLKDLGSIGTPSLIQEGSEGSPEPMSRLEI